MLQLGISVVQFMLPVLLVVVSAGPASALEESPPAAVKAIVASNPSFSDPQEVSVAGDTFNDAYFGMTLTLPSWTEDVQGPPPSPVGYYVLDTFNEPQPGKTYLLIAAQDTFFSINPFKTAAEMTADFRTNNLPKIPNAEIEPGPATMTLSGHVFERVDYNAGGLYRTWLATDLRCHIVLMNLTGPERPAVEAAVKRLDALTLAPDSGPLCVKGYITRKTTTHFVTLPPVPKGQTVPVRVIIGPDGAVRHVHVIRPPDDWTGLGIATAMQKWQFKPYLVDGTPTEIETGVDLRSGGMPE